jgi:hypothetical protein
MHKAVAVALAVVVVIVLVLLWRRNIEGFSNSLRPISGINITRPIKSPKISLCLPDESNGSMNCWSHNSDVNYNWYANNADNMGISHAFAGTNFRDMTERPCTKILSNSDQTYWHVMNGQ